ncbi:hypothetical protein J2Y45_000394 [Dyadobacter sp. BE34]|uniref:Uncharacterized protein n=1 Tax=Dyadobacter fermentans TaxID=94254 RepID=A0ABU1QR07_9BACT|nr:hypothetical protein [Dyadobacter fermentans]MDR7040866.1 hypothetical protein [Dyadobacter sp. BE242]MDR7195268.1 hypothetical protein [Dyadobacter sp. BE34]MDR7214186.1 hypothetical protein [Dyadobacter sp. BE31]MDR7260676.1 hypothetical protein [Dyadobacter sp. BE32]
MCFWNDKIYANLIVKLGVSVGVSIDALKLCGELMYIAAEIIKISEDVAITN